MLQEKHNKKPITLSEVLEYLNVISGNTSSSYGANITVESLHSGHFSERPEMHINHFSDELQALVAASQAAGKTASTINDLQGEMQRLNAHRFLPLVSCANEANVAIALYAGDGIVMKITKSSELKNSNPENGNYKPTPGVLPPITRTEIDGYMVEMFPWVNTFDISNKDVEKMEAFLGRHGLAFNFKDAKTNNIGRMPDGTLVVLDGDAVHAIDARKPPAAHATEQWMHKVHEQFGPLYHAPDPAKLISNAPDFSLSFSPLLELHKPKMHAVTSEQNITTVARKDVKPASRSFFSWLSLGQGAKDVSA